MKFIRKLARVPAPVVPEGVKFDPSDVADLVRCYSFTEVASILGISVKTLRARQSDQGVRRPNAALSPRRKYVPRQCHVSPAHGAPARHDCDPQPAQGVHRVLQLGVGQERDVRRQVIGKDSQVMLINRPRVDPPGQRLDLKSGLVPGLVHGWARRQTDSLRG